MATENKSPSYLQARESVRKWLSSTPEGRYAVDLWKKQDGISQVSKVLDDDAWVDWETMVQEQKNNLAIAWNCQEVRNAVDLCKKTSTISTPPTSKGAKWIRFFSPEMGYVLRRQIETMDPDYWNDPKNIFREALNNPQWLTVPADYVRGELEKYLGTSTEEKAKSGEKEISISGTPDSW